MASPSFTVPRPCGRPLPSGRIAISQPAISSRVASRPRCKDSLGPAVASGPPLPGFGPLWAQPTPTTTPAASAASRKGLSHFDILDLPVEQDVPGLNAVVVVDRVQAAILTQLSLAWLHIAGFVHRPRLEEQLAPV